MATRKPLVTGLGDHLLEELPTGDTLSTADITDSTNKRFVTDAEKAAIGAAAGEQNLVIQDTEPDAHNIVWLQTNVDGVNGNFSLWFKE